ncbi:MAG TPA: glycosyltransferase [Candidatus Limnocylindrales bacterium]|nr:glycosyltransferase [Candidatus Limnocylindrales bacterium]
MRLDIVVLGLSITSSWGNGHATTYRSLLRALRERGHRVTFLERDVPWYAANRDLPAPSYCPVHLYDGIDQLEREHAARVAAADLVIVGSYVPDGIAVGDWVLATAAGVTAFYDIDTPVTLANLERGGAEYLLPRQIALYELYLSFTGGPTLQRLESDFGSRCARALYCSVDADAYPCRRTRCDYDLGYLGTYSEDRQAPLEELMFETAVAWPRGSFIVAGPQYPASVCWPTNVEHVEHLAPPQHPGFYASQRFTLNLTRADMKRAGFSPSVRLFEAAACGTPVISDYWPGLEQLFVPGREILIARDADDVLRMLSQCDEGTRLQIGEASRRRVLSRHTSRHRAHELEQFFTEARDSSRTRRVRAATGGSASIHRTMEG